jgi:hypothetical protein
MGPVPIYSEQSVMTDLVKKILNRRRKYKKIMLFNISISFHVKIWILYL